MSDSMAVATAAVDALRHAGARDVVLAPGSRSAPLAYALHQADADGALRLHVRIDERTAAFLAVGLAKGAHRRPAAVVTTSGTAVANLHPAVLEAVHAGVPLIVVSADRPAALRDTGANQTTDQPGLFGPRVPVCDVSPGDVGGVAAAIAAAGRRRGPTHVNVQLAEPLTPEALPLEIVAPDHAADQAGRDEPTPERLPRGPRTVVVAGDDAGPPARMLAQRANWPLLAEPTSGARTGTHAIRAYRLLLGGALGADVERVVVVGHPTLSRPVTQLISRPDLEVLSVRSAAGVSADPGRVARRLSAVPKVDGSDDDAWIARWLAEDARLSAAVDEIAASSEGHPLRVAAEVARAIAPGALLVAGSSQPIRDLDLMMTPYPPEQRRLIIGNRGLAGIDGTLSTAIGAALARPSPRALAYVGDLTFLHDANGLIIGPDEPHPALTVIVLNDDGGSIFSTLEQGAARLAGAYERIFGTPHGVSIEALCAATATAYEKIADPVELRAALDREQAGLRVIEVPTSRTRRRALDESLRALT
jgi:2-succinyl-5-enolpyruvyl-6-hydroxy-3-cyclohexene-1-carboxylate synthase